MTGGGGDGRKALGMNMIRSAKTLAILGLMTAMAAQAQTNRIQFNKQSLFLSGINVAWDHFADDIGPNPSTPDEAYFDDVFSQVQTNGGNALRIWLHVTGEHTPAWSGSTVTGPGSGTIVDLRSILDRARQYEAGIILTLWSFDMLSTNNSATITDRSMMILTNVLARKSYVDNALTPMVQALRGHPSIIAWEIFNEPEGMSDEFGWNFTRHVPMADIQAFINVCAGAIHQADPSAKVTSGAWSLKATTDVGDGNTNYYTDARLVSAGGDNKGTLDFYTVHYYDPMGTNTMSPFNHPCSYWLLDKPLVVSEFFPPAGENVCVNCGSNPYEYLYQNGYAGALTWSWTDSDHSSMLAQLASMAGNHLIDVELVPILTVGLRTNSIARLSWPSPSNGWSIQQSDLTTTNWVTPVEAVNDDGADKYVVFSPVTGKRFFRLHRGQ